MNDLIYRQAAIDAIKKSIFLVDAMEKVIKLPSAQPRKGKWMPLQLSIAYPPYQCSCCFGNAPMVMVGTSRLKKGHLEALLTDFCPNCGAEMERRQDDNNY